MVFRCLFKAMLYISLLNPTALCLVTGRSLIKPIEWDFRTKKLSSSEQRLTDGLRLQQRSSSR